MSTRNGTLGLAMFAAMLAFSASTAHAALCETGTAFDSTAKPLPKSANWRKDATNLNQDGGYTETKASREAGLKTNVKDMETDVLGGATPGMITEFAENVDWDYLVMTGGYGSHVVDRLEVRGIGSSGVLDATMLLPVSGHTGVDNAKKWAVSDTYDIVWETGTRYQPGYEAKKLITGAKSRGLITVQEVKIPLIKGQIVKVSYYRSGSLGPAGYVEGRVIELVWDGT